NKHALTKITPDGSSEKENKFISGTSSASSLAHSSHFSSRRRNQADDKSIDQPSIPLMNGFSRRKNKHALTKITPDGSSEKENKFISGTSSASSLAHSSHFSSRRRNQADDKSIDQPSIPLMNGFSRRTGKPLPKDDPQSSTHASNGIPPILNGLVEDHENHTKIMRPMMDKEHLLRKNSRKRHFSSVSADAPTSCAKHIKTGLTLNSAAARTDALCQRDGVSQDVDHHQASVPRDDNIIKCYLGRRSLLDWDSFISLSKKHRRLSLQPNGVNHAVDKLSPSSQGNTASTCNNHALNQPSQRLEPDSHFTQHYTSDVKTQKNHFAIINTYTTKHPKAIAGSTIHFDRASAKGLKVTYSPELLGHRVVSVPTPPLPSAYHAVTNKLGTSLRSFRQSAKFHGRFSKRHTLDDSANSRDTPIQGVIEPITLKTDKDHCVHSNLQSGVVPNVVQQSPVKLETDSGLSEMTISLEQPNSTGRHSVVSKAASVLTTVNAVDPQDLSGVSSRSFLRRSVRKSRRNILSLVRSSGSVGTAQSLVNNSDAQPMGDQSDATAAISVPARPDNYSQFSETRTVRLDSNNICRLVSPFERRRHTMSCVTRASLLGSHKIKRASSAERSDCLSAATKAKRMDRHSPRPATKELTILPSTETQPTADDYTNEVVISRNSLRPRKSSTSPSVTMCPYCSRTMLYPMGLKRHLRLCRAQSDDDFNNIHEDAITPVRQGTKTTQEIRSTTESALTSTTHTQFNDCPYCTRRCSNSGYLKLHIRACKLAPVTVSLLSSIGFRAQMHSQCILTIAFYFPATFCLPERDFALVHHLSNPY
ncbi:hypothetical protein AHF37_10800, partial [Paragonimus kellicotti]